MKTTYEQKDAEISAVCEAAATYKTEEYWQDDSRTRFYREGLCDTEDPKQGKYTIEDYYALPTSDILPLRI